MGQTVATQWIVPPLIHRELAAALRRKDALKGRQRFSLIAGAASAFCLLFAALGASEIGRAVFPGLFFAGLYLAGPNTLQRSAGMFTQERQSESFGFLFLAGLSASEIFLSKILGVGFVAFSELLALAPFIAVPFLIGGLSLTAFTATICCLPIIMFYVLALAALGSAWSENENSATAAAIGIGAMICTAAPLCYWLKRSFGKGISSGWLTTSPAYGPWMILNGLGSSSVADFWRTSEFTLGESFLLFAIAAVLLRNNWRKDPSPGGCFGWRRIWDGFKARGRVAPGRRRWLEINPFIWLALGDRRSEWLGWAALFAAAIGWGLGAAIFRKSWWTAPTVFLFSTAVAVVLGQLIATTAARDMARLRREHVLETLLTTPLRVAEIVDGQMQALRLRFRRLLCGIIIFDIAIMAPLPALWPWNWRARAVYLVLCSLLVAAPVYCRGRTPWMRMWISFNCGRVFYSQKKTGWNPLWTWFWILFNIRWVLSSGSFGLGPSSFPSGSVAEFVIVIICAVFTSLFVAAVDLSQEKRGQFIREFRFIAQEPLPEANDPRFKVWNVQSRFPQPPVKDALGI